MCSNRCWMRLEFAAVLTLTSWLAAGVATGESNIRERDPWGVVREYLNLDATEASRQRELSSNGLQEIRPILTPEGPVGFLGWPHGMLVERNLLVHVRAGALLLGSRDGGRTWKTVRRTPENIYVGARTVRGAKAVIVGVDRARPNTLSVMTSLDQGDTWDTRDVSVKTPRHLTSRIAVHPRFGLIAGGHPSVNELTFLASDDDGESWRYVAFALPGLYTDGTVVFTWKDNLGVFARGRHGGGNGWSTFAQCYPTNMADAERFEDLSWECVQTNIFVAKMDTPDAYYNPVTECIEAVVTKRDAGFPYRDTGLNHALNGRGYMTLNLWSIDSPAFLSGQGTWRFEGAILRSRGEKARRADPRDGMHPAGSVVDEENGLHHIFIYAGDYAHGDGAPNTGRTGIFHISRCLDTRRWRAKIAELDAYDAVYGVDEDFASLDDWIATGDPTGSLEFQRTEPPRRLAEAALPLGLVEATHEGYLHIRTHAPGYYAVHHENCIITKDYVVEFRVRASRYAWAGDTFGLNINYGPWKQHLILRNDGLYEYESPEETRRIAEINMDHDWHVWSAVMRDGIARVSLDGQPVGKGAAMVDPGIGNRPVTLYVNTPKESDMADVYIDYLRIDNLNGATPNAR